MRKFLVLGGLTAALAFPVGVRANDQPVKVTPFEVLKEHPRCTGPGRIAFRVAFDVKSAKARFGIAGEERVEICSVKSRKGGEISKYTFPCPDDDGINREFAKDLNGSPREVDLSGSIITCMGVDEVTFVDGNWQMLATTRLGILREQGNFFGEGLSVIFKGPESGPLESTRAEFRATPPILVILWDGVDMSLNAEQGPGLEFSSYLAFSPGEQRWGWCREDGCSSYVSDRASVVKGLGTPQARDLVDFVEDE